MPEAGDSTPISAHEGCLIIEKSIREQRGSENIDIDFSIICLKLQEACSLMGERAVEGRSGNWGEVVTR